MSPRVSRRSFLGKASVAMVGGAAAVRGLYNGGAIASPPRAAARSKTASSEPVVAYVENGQQDEVTILVGSREIVHQDPDLVSRLLHAAR